jgi:O-antigen ligase
MQYFKVSNDLRPIAMLLPTLGYILFSIMPYATAGKYIAAGLVLISFLLGCLMKGIDFKPKFVFEYALYAVLIGAGVSAALNPEDSEATAVILKHGVPFLLSWLIIKSQKVEQQKVIAWLLLTVCLAYSYRVIMAGYAGVANGFQFSAYVRPIPKFLDFFAADSIFYIPFMLGAILYLSLNKITKFLLSLVLVLGLVLVALSGVRTSLVLTLVTIAWFVVFRYWRYWRYLLTIFVVVSSVLVGIAFYLANKPWVDATENSLLTRYISLLHPKTYEAKADWSLWERKAIAKGVWELSERAPIFGHGLGWKKLPDVAAREGYMDKWKASQAPIDKTLYDYFLLGRGQVNPHNFYLMLFFEVGAVGLVAYCILLLALFVFYVRLLATKPDRFIQGVVATSLAYLLVTFIAGFAGGSWLPTALLALLGAASLLFPTAIDTKSVQR